MLHACGTPGIFVNDYVSSLHMIMYADDICAVNDTVDRVSITAKMFSKCFLSTIWSHGQYGEKPNRWYSEWRAFEN